MKKIVICSLVVLFGATSAMAAALYVPFFNDGGDLMQGGLPSPESGWATFIGLLNTTGGDLELTLTYRDSAGADITSGNTMNLPANGVLSWRPYADDNAEGPGKAVPNADEGIGSVQIDLPGALTEVIGRVVLINEDDFGQSQVNLEGF